MIKLSRRNVLQTASIASMLSLAGWGANAKQTSQPSNEGLSDMALTAGKNKVAFKSFGVDLVGDLYLPEGFDETKKYKAIVGASPFPQVKDQIPATYGPEMAARGFHLSGLRLSGHG